MSEPLTIVESKTNPHLFGSRQLRWGYSTFGSFAIKEAYLIKVNAHTMTHTRISRSIWGGRFGLRWLTFFGSYNINKS